MQFVTLQSYNGLKPVSDSYEQVAIDLICKGAIFIGAGVGLYIALRLLKGVKSPQ